VATVSERETRDLEELNLALGILRKSADKEGYVPGSPVELVYTSLTRSGRKISLSRVRNLITRLGELGWREEAWIGPKNVRGSKIVMQPQAIESLEILPAKVEREKFEKEVTTWFSRSRTEIVATWKITNPRKHTENTTITIIGYTLTKSRGQKRHWVFRLDDTTPHPQWLKSMLAPDGTLADSALYTLWKSGHARLGKDKPK